VTVRVRLRPKRLRPRLARPRCVVCSRGGPGMLELADGRMVHRWPCRERMR
jgi:hypothetical protein